MIINRLAAELELIDQVEHGRVAGLLAEAWGNAEFTAPAPVPAVSLAAARHDEGWRSVDGALLFDELAKRPMHFLDIDVERHIKLYRQGVERVSMLDAYAGLLVGMHWSGIYRSRWQRPGGVSRLARSPEDRELQEAVVRAEEERWIGVRQQVWTEDEPRALFETRLWHHFELLQLWDLLSLFLCVVPNEPAPPQPVVPWGPQLSGIDHRSETVTLPTVGRYPGGPRVDVVARVAAPGLIDLDPFPFPRTLEIEVAVKVLPQGIEDRAAAQSHLEKRDLRIKRWQVAAPVAANA